MPAERTAKTSESVASGKTKRRNELCFMDKNQKVIDALVLSGVINENWEQESNNWIKKGNYKKKSSEFHYPKTPMGRVRYASSAGKGLTPYQWAIYDFTLAIPKGKVTTYRDVAQIVGGSSRSVGNALRSNPFAPHIPCHRVIAANNYIGGFMGEWGTSGSTKSKSKSNRDALGSKSSSATDVPADVNAEKSKCERKLDLLASEGVLFDKKGYLVNKNDLLRAEDMAIWAA